jgi:hypothetical protein
LTSWYAYETEDGRAVGLARVRAEGGELTAEVYTPSGGWVEDVSVMADLRGTPRPRELGQDEAARLQAQIRS